ncbi:Electron transfer flavoprotein alpha-subunit [Umbelopsis nana]
MLAALRPNILSRAVAVQTRPIFQRFYASGSGNNSLLVVEHRNGAVDGATLNALTAAQALGGDITAIVAGDAPETVAKEIAKYGGVSKVLVAKNDAYAHNLPETLAPLLVEAQKKLGFSHVFAGHTAFGKNVLPRVAALLDVAAISDITGVEGADTFVRPIYAGNAIATVKSSDNVKIITVRGTAFPAATPAQHDSAQETAPEADKPALSEWISEELVKSDRPDLNSAKRVIAGGRGMKNGENFQMLYDLADKIGAAVGASRAAVDAGYVDNSLQIGQTGKIVAPELYIAVGISGAIQHLAGMKDSKTIVAINKDAEAPIFQVADYGLVEDLFKAVPEITQKL